MPEVATTASVRRIGSSPMRLWRLTRTGQTALDGAGTLMHGAGTHPLGAPVVSFASRGRVGSAGGSA